MDHDNALVEDVNAPTSRRRVLASAAAAAAGAGLLARPAVGHAVEGSALGPAERAAVRTAEATATKAPREGGSGLGWTYRHDWGNRNGYWKLNLNSGAINRNSAVFVSIAEGAAGGGKFLGAARYTLFNVAPHDGTVGIWLHIDWNNPLRLYVDYLVIPL